VPSDDAKITVRISPMLRTRAGAAPVVDTGTVMESGREGASQGEAYDAGIIRQ
jgi:hypothetical protein